MKRVAVLLLIIALAVLGWLYLRQSPACNLWHEQVGSMIRRSHFDQSPHTSTLEEIQARLEPSRPLGCPRL